jgi:spore coat protein A, manganese oxidase
MINRRRFLEAGAVAGVGAMLPLKAGHAAERMAGVAGGDMMAAAAGVSPALQKYVDLLPIPTSFFGFAYAPTGLNAAGAPHYDIAASAFFQKLHRDLPATYLWGYGGTFPSRTIEATVGSPIEVSWINNLLPTDVHPIASAIDRTNVGGMTDMNGLPWPDQRITTHVHGGHVPWTSDGGPKTWYTGPFWRAAKGGYVAGNKVIYDGFNNGNTYQYPNNQVGTTLWFHDHAMGITRYNVYAGLAGFWLLRAPNEASLNLPSGAYEVPIVIQDRIFNADGSLYYTPAPAVPEFFGDTMVVNGKVWPRLQVEPRKYRLRFLNGCNARFLRMQIVQATAIDTLPSNRNWVTLPFTQIGAEGGFFAAPAAPATQMLLAPAERADVIIDFSGQANKKFIVFNDAATPFNGSSSTRGAIPEVMMFDVSLTLTGTDTSVIPATFDGLGGFVDTLGNPAAPVLAGAINVPKTLTEIALPNGMLMQLIDQSGYEVNPITGAPSPMETATLGTTEIWQIVNTTVDTHPIHLHQTAFQVLDRQAVNVSAYTKALGTAPGIDPTPYVTGKPMPAGPDEAGWKETVRANPGEVTRIAMKWTDYAGNYVYHCHILEHEEHDMMRALTILPAPVV